MKTLLPQIIEVALRLGAPFAEARWVHTRTLRFRVRNGRLLQPLDVSDCGLGLRVMIDGLWAFTSHSSPSAFLLRPIVEQAMEVARAGAAMPHTPPSDRRPIDPVAGAWVAPAARDPFALPPGEVRDLVRTLHEAVAAAGAGCETRAELTITQRDVALQTTAGVAVEQRWTSCGVQLSASANCRVVGHTQWRTLGPYHRLGGWEHIAGLDFTTSAERLAADAAALAQAPPCPEGTFDVVLGPSIVAILLHEAAGGLLHADALVEGRSPFTTDGWRDAELGNARVTITADPTLPDALGAYAFDDEGAAAQRRPLVRQGRVVSLLTDAAHAARLDLPASTACARAASAHVPPIIRTPPLVLEEGDEGLVALLQGAAGGFFIDGVRSWVIDRERRRVEVRAEVARRIEPSGRLGEAVRDPVLLADVLALWRRCDGLADQASARLVSLPRVRKGSPAQTLGVSHRVVPMRLRGVTLRAG